MNLLYTISLAVNILLRECAYRVSKQFFQCFFASKTPDIFVIRHAEGKAGRNVGEKPVLEGIARDELYAFVEFFAKSRVKLVFQKLGIGSIDRKLPAR